MDFWDIFIKLEQYNNSLSIKTIKEVLKIDEKITDIIIYDDFIDINSLDNEELSSILLFFNNTKNLNDFLDLEKNIPTYFLIYLIKFYNFIFDDLSDVAYNLSQLCSARLCYMPTGEIAQNNFNTTKEIYSNFKKRDNSYNLDFKEISGKLFLVYNNKIIVIYLKKEENNYDN
jgi:hypothetical protein